MVGEWRVRPQPYVLHFNFIHCGCMIDASFMILKIRSYGSQSQRLAGKAVRSHRRVISVLLAIPSYRRHKKERGREEGKKGRHFDECNDRNPHYNEGKDELQYHT